MNVFTWELLFIFSHGPMREWAAGASVMSVLRAVPTNELDWSCPDAGAPTTEPSTLQGAAEQTLPTAFGGPTSQG